ncbi:SAF domain-containing protein [soil metagenome]
MARLAGWPRRLLALALLVTAAVLAVRDSPPGSGTGGVEVLVAARDLAPGTPVAVEDLAVAIWPEQLLPAGVLHPGEEPVGRLVAGPVRAGEVLTGVRVVGPGLAAALGDGLRAVPVRLADPGAAALLRPGDRIDLYAVAGPHYPETAAESTLVAAAALVLAVPEQGDGIVPEGGIVVVAVTEATAGMLLHAAYSRSIAATLAPP